MILSKRCFFFIAIFFGLFGWNLQADEQTPPLHNQLKNHPSPYLAMHGNDPVVWQEWGPEVLEQAQKINKLIFISSGYFSCHWCHVMHRESYSNPVLAQLLNEYFIPVKIDRELRPALDDYLIDFVQQTTGSAGWPLNTFLTPDGYPLMGFTYEPADAFKTLLLNVSQAWQKQPEKAKRLAKEAAEFLAKQNLSQQEVATFTLDEEQLMALIVNQGLTIADDLEGGFGQQSRFPMTPQLSVLLAYLKKHENSVLSEFLTLTLDQMKTLGLRDHLNGGFFRYTVDPGWTHPHFEKMLYTQALLVPIYLEAAQVLQRPDYKAVARDTLDFVLREFASSQGGYIASSSAVDEQGSEGSGYLWTKKELSTYLNEQEQQLLIKYWDMQAKPVFEKGHLPMLPLSLQEVAKEQRLSLSQANALFASATKKLRAVHKIALMPIDHKVITAWNALFLSALSQAAVVFDDEGYRQQAKALRDVLVKQAWDGQHLLRAHDGDKVIGRAGLEDYAYLAEAMQHYFALEKKEEDKRLMDELIVNAWQYFYHASGWKTGNENLLPAMQGKPALADGALPAADAILLRLSLQSEHAAIRQKALQALRLMLPTIHELPFSYATHAFNVPFLHSSVSDAAN